MQVRGLLSQVDAATMLDLLAAHSYGKTAKMVLYRPLLDALERTLTPPSPRVGTATHAALQYAPLCMCVFGR